MVNNIEEYVAKIHSDGYVVLKNAIDHKSVKEILSFIKSYEYTSSEKEKIALSKMRLNEYAENLFNVALKKPEYLKHFIRGFQGEIAKGCSTMNITSQFLLSYLITY